MKVTLLEFTGKGSDNEQWRAADLLIFTKSTRLTMSPGLMEGIAAWPIEKKMEELEYMANTIPSSWEFVDYHFLIEGVTRAFTHQFVRTRTNSYAQQTMRVLDVSEGMGWDYLTGPSIEKNPDVEWIYRSEMEKIGQTYKTLIAKGSKIEDARGILPTNILTNIVCKTSLRTLAETVQKRSSPRTQGEYRDVLEAMKSEVLKVHPWVELFFNRTSSKAIEELQIYINNLKDVDDRIRATKLLDQLRIKI
jgi:flavin-dependent thymidylate synthase